jgi:thiamine-phosphate pyrophosphorylase
MGLDRPISGLYFIADPAHIKGASLADAVSQAVEGGASVVQLRAKDAGLQDMLTEAGRLMEICHRAGVLFIVNDSAELAMACGADGVHLGQDDMPLGTARGLIGPGKLVGISTHNIEQAIAAEQGGADYIGFGPIFSTCTKDAGEARGTGLLRQVRDSVGIPVVAIGGINEYNAQQAIEAGADAVAVITAISGAGDKRGQASILSGFFSRR